MPRRQKSTTRFESARLRHSLRVPRRQKSTMRFESARLRHSLRVPPRTRSGASHGSPTRAALAASATPLPLFCPATKNGQSMDPAGSHSRGVTGVHAPLERNRPMRPRILGRMCNSAEIHTKKCHLFTPRPPPLANFWTNFGRLCFKGPTRTLRPTDATNSDLGDNSFCRFGV